MESLDTWPPPIWVLACWCEIIRLGRNNYPNCGTACTPGFHTLCTVLHTRDLRTGNMYDLDPPPLTPPSPCIPPYPPPLPLVHPDHFPFLSISHVSPEDSMYVVLPNGLFVVCFGSPIINDPHVPVCLVCLLYICLSVLHPVCPPLPCLSAIHFSLPHLSSIQPHIPVPVSL